MCLYLLNLHWKERIIIKERRKVDFASTQLYFTIKDEIDALNEDYASLGLNNKSDYLRGLVLLGLKTKKKQERNVLEKEEKTLLKLDDVSVKLNEIKDLLSNVDFNDSIYELFEELKKSFDECFVTLISTVNGLNKKIDSLTEHYDKVLGSIYKLIYSMCMKERISKKDLDNGLFDELPDRLKGGDLNK